MVNPDGITDMPGDGEVTYPSETGQALIPYQIMEETYDYYEVRNYVNDINQDYTQVLTGYDEKGRIRESYTYGITGNSGENSSVTETAAAVGGRLDYSDGKNSWYYGYTGTGSVAQLTDKEGALAAAYRYDAFGNTSVQDYIGNITGNKKITENYTRNPYTYNAEYTDASTGNQYLRARYYSPETGNFFTEDSYLGSLLEPLERNLYTYAENDPVNYSDPSGHGIKSKLKKAWGKVTSAVGRIASTIGRAAGVVSTAASSIFKKAQSGLNKYMNSESYKKYFRNAGTSSRRTRTGYTSYSYVEYNRNRSYGLAIGGIIRYFQTEAELNTIRKICETAARIKTQSDNKNLLGGREKARIYMEQYYKEPNGEYPYWDSDGGNCANFVSQTLVAGGVKTSDKWYMENGNIIDEVKSHLWDKGKYNVSDGKKYTNIWSLAPEQYKYFSDTQNGYINGEVLYAKNTAEIKNLLKNNNVQVGDLLYWDYYGEGVTHATIISKVDYETGKIFFAGNTKPRFDEEITDKKLSNYKGGVRIVRIKDESYN